MARTPNGKYISSHVPNDMTWQEFEKYAAIKKLMNKLVFLTFSFSLDFGEKTMAIWMVNAEVGTNRSWLEGDKDKIGE